MFQEVLRVNRETKWAKDREKKKMKKIKKMVRVLIAILIMLIVILVDRSIYRNNLEKCIKKGFAQNVCAANL